jgi:hypothetical protein
MLGAEMNITLGLGNELNVEIRDAFTEILSEKLVTLNLVPERLEAMSNHLGQEQRKGRGGQNFPRRVLASFLLRLTTVITP